MKKTRSLLLVGLIALIILACSAATAPVGRWLATDTPTPLPTLTITLAAPTATALPTPTAALLPTSISALREPEPTPDGPAATPASGNPFFDEYLPGHTQVAETEHFTFHTNGDGYLPVDLERWKVEAEVIYAYVAERVQAESDEKVAVGFLPPQQQECPIRGLAAQGDPPQVILYADENSPETYLFGVLAHELGHSIPSEGFPGGLPNDLALTEGLATWASGKYWEAWKNVDSMDALVNQYIEQGVYLPLNEAVTMPQVYPWQDGAGKDCLERRDQIYAQWGGFVGYLIERYGWEKVHQLFESARTVVENDQNVNYPTDYPAVLGLALNQIEAEWLNEIRQ
jgi:hypothetical protein